MAVKIVQIFGGYRYAGKFCSKFFEIFIERRHFDDVVLRDKRLDAKVQRRILKKEKYYCGDLEIRPF